MVKEKLLADLKDAMKAKDSTSVSTVRMLLSGIKNKEIEKKDELTDAEVVKLLQGEKKKRLESIQQFEAGGRTDLVEKEKGEVVIIEKYLPAGMSDEELQKIVAVAAATGGGDFGKTMKAVMAAAGGRADGAKVSEMVKRILMQKST